MTKPGEFIKTLPTSPRLPPLRVVRIPTRGVEEEEPIISVMQLDGLDQEHPARMDYPVFEVIRWHLMTGAVCLLVPWDADVHRSPFPPAPAPVSTRVDNPELRFPVVGSRESFGIDGTKRFVWVEVPKGLHGEAVAVLMAHFGLKP